jgi:1,6-anhydro-N-acetylmuramate kinase
LRRRRPRASNVPASSELRDDVLRLKIALDAARDVIAQERKQSRRLARLLADAVESLQEEQRLADAAEIITEQYASIVTTHLMPDPPEPSEPTLGDA